MLDAREQTEASIGPTIDAVCEGTPFEMGLTQGESLAGKIQGTIGVLSELEALRLDKPRWLPFGAYRRALEWRVAMSWKGFGIRQSDAWSRLEGIAVGAATRRRAILLMNALEPVMASVEGRIVTPPLGGCSAVALRGSRSASGEPMIGRNFDYLPVLQPFYSLRRCHPNDGYRSMEFTLAPLSGAVDGMNEHGLCLVYDYAFVIDEPTPDATISMGIAEALRRCRTVDEAVTFLKQTPRWGGGIIMLADATGDIASLELSNTRAATRRPADGEDHLFHSNRFAMPKMSGVEAPPDAVFTDRAPTVLRGNRVLASSDVRDQRFAQLLHGAGALDTDDLQRLLADHGDPQTEGKNSICMHSEYWTTTASLQFFPRSRKIRVAYDSTCCAQYKEFAVV